MSAKCPICGDPNAYPLWIDKEPPAGCAHDETWHKTGRLQSDSVRSVTECGYQMRKAMQAAEFRRLTPDAFDDKGAMLPGALPRVLLAYGHAHPNRELVL